MFLNYYVVQSTHILPRGKTIRIQQHPKEEQGQDRLSEPLDRARLEKFRQLPNFIK